MHNRSSDPPTAVDFDPDMCLEKIMSMLSVNPSQTDTRPQGVEDSHKDEEEGSEDDLDSLSCGSLGDEGEEGQGEELQELMELMDEQLADTAVGKSFEREVLVC